MQVYKNTQSTIKPNEFEINPYKVFIAKNIQTIENNSSIDEEENIKTFYQYDLYEYTHEEYINILRETNETLQQEVLDTQMALCDIYEAMG